MKIGRAIILTLQIISSHFGKKTFKPDYMFSQILSQIPKTLQRIVALEYALWDIRTLFSYFFIRFYRIFIFQAVF